jgi:hypothetical protein
MHTGMALSGATLVNFKVKKFMFGIFEILPHTKISFFNWASEAHAGGIKILFTFAIWDFEHAGNPINSHSYLFSCNKPNPSSIWDIFFKTVHTHMYIATHAMH